MIFAPAQSGLGVILIEIGQCIKPDSPRHIDSKSAYSALFSMPEMFYIEPVNELVEELTRGAVMAV